MTRRSCTRAALAFALLGLPACSGGGEDTDADTEAGTDTDTDGDGDCPNDQEFFAAELWGPTFSMTCVSCHHPEGLAKDTRMVLMPGEGADVIAYNFEQVAAMAAIEEDGTSLLLLKPTGAHADGHGGGVVVTPGSSAYAALEEFVARVDGSFTCDDGGTDTGGPVVGCDEGGGPRTIRRLSHVEYNRTIVDLLGLSGELAGLGLSFAPDNVVHGYSNNAGALTVSGLLADQYREVAEQLADEIVVNLGVHLACDPINDGEEACAAAFVTEFGGRVFRRPLTATERARYDGLYAEVAAEDGFEEGVYWVAAAMLQAPGFLYRTELGVHEGDGVYALTPHELAAELSYLIVGAPPDAPLRAAADDGTLADPEVLAAHADRLLALPQSQRTLERFVDEWLGLSRLPLVTRDPTLFPELTPELRAAMLGETHRLVGEVYREGGTLSDLLTAGFSYVNDGLAAYYGIPAGAGEADAEGFRRVELTGARLGLLTQGGVLTTHALPTTSSPIHRGKLVRERLLCQELPPPPPSLDTSPPPVDPDLSTRERYEMHSADPACKGCHERIDPIGFGFEHFDGVGRYRETDGPHAIDVDGEIVQTTSTNATFSGAAELAGVLAQSSEVTACYAEQWAEFALGAADDAGLACVREDLGAAFVESGGRLDALVTALVASPYFIHRYGDGGAPVDPGDDTTGDDTTGDDSTTTGDDSTTTGDDSTSTTTGTTGGGDDVEVEVVNDSSWPTGECNTVFVYNVSAAPVTWEVQLTLAGALQNFWNAKATVNGLDATFVGEDYNATIEANGTTSFGFCVNF
ncbi:MAG: DUF1592 domain-containing protein [Nannocystaceae bacterium]